MPVLANNSLKFKVNRAISIQKVTGQVLRLRNQQEEPAIVGDSLQDIGDGLRTKAKSSAILALDTGVGTLEVSSETILRIQAIQISPHGGYITRLFLSQGQVRVKLKSFINSESKFEIHTPSSVSGVRGTSFGVAVQPNGNTAVAIESGQVGVTVPSQMLESADAQMPDHLNLSPGDSALIPMGQQPIQQKPGIVKPEMSLTWLTSMQGTNKTGSLIRIAGSTNPLNLLQIDDRALPIGLDGQFECVLPLPTSRKVSVLITTPLGNQRYYELVVS